MVTLRTAPVDKSCAFICSAPAGSAAAAGMLRRIRPGRLARTSTIPRKEGSFIKLCPCGREMAVTVVTPSSAHQNAFSMISSPCL